jgi:hypothetical protein
MIVAAPLANLAALCTLETSRRMPTYEYNWFGQNRYRATSSEPLPLGKSTIRVEFKYDGGGPAKGGNVTMRLNDKKVAEGRVEGTIFGRFLLMRRLTSASIPARRSGNFMPHRSSLRARSTGLRSRQTQKNNLCM